MRSKEDALDYKYFTDPNLPPVKISREWVNEIKEEIPRLQYERSLLYINDYGISRKDAYTIVREMEISDYYEECISLEDYDIYWYNITEPEEYARIEGFRPVKKTFYGYKDRNYARKSSFFE